MAEHGEKNFEHELAKMFKKLDDEIKIPEIPDAQSIFEKAEVKEKKIIPFKKYSKYIAAAAAVVLVAAGIPVISGALSGSIGLDNMASMEFAVQEEPEEAPSEIELLTDKMAEGSKIEVETEVDSDCVTEESMNEPIPEYYPSYASSSVSEDEKMREPEEGLSVKDVLYKYFIMNSFNDPFIGGSGYDDLHTIEEELNKKRSIDITVEESSVSVVLHDNSASEEIINAFWVEGNYESSYLDGNYYIINLSNYVSKEDIENNSYLPMAGDAGGVYTIPEKSVFIPEEITEGKISLAVEIDIGTGEYKIYASLV